MPGLGPGANHQLPAQHRIGGTSDLSHGGRWGQLPDLDSADGDAGQDALGGRALVPVRGRG